MHRSFCRIRSGDRYIKEERRPWKFPNQLLQIPKSLLRRSRGAEEEVDLGFLSPSSRIRSTEEEELEMMPVAEMAELLGEYTAAVAGALEHLLLRAPIPWRIRTLILRRVPFAAQPPPVPPTPYALRFRLIRRPATPSSRPA